MVFFSTVRQSSGSAASVAFRDRYLKSVWSVKNQYRTIVKTPCSSRVKSAIARGGDGVHGALSAYLNRSIKEVLSSTFSTVRMDKLKINNGSKFVWAIYSKKSPTGILMGR